MELSYVLLGAFIDPNPDWTGPDWVGPRIE